MTNPIDGPGKYIRRNGDVVELVHEFDSGVFEFVSNDEFGLYYNSSEPTGNITCPESGSFPEFDIIAKVES